jgi:pimeloyl-CoA synthetase
MKWKSPARGMQRRCQAAASNVEKMLKPLKIHTIHVRTAFEARRALAKVLEEIGKLYHSERKIE